MPSNGSEGIWKANNIAFGPNDNLLLYTNAVMSIYIIFSY